MRKGKEPEKTVTPQGREKIPSLHAIRKPGQRTLPWLADKLGTALHRKTDIGKPGPSTIRKFVEIDRDDEMDECDEMDDAMGDETYSQPTIDSTCLE
jgi:hypothetical protein